LSTIAFRPRSRANCAKARHQAWTAYDAHLEDASDEAIVVYAGNRRAIVVTTNKDFVPTARRMAIASVVYLRVTEAHAVETLTRALAWLETNQLPDGRVLRVSRRGKITVMAPLRW